MSSTVRLHVEVQISHVDDNYDTGVTVDAWNAMTPDERSDIKSEAWQGAAQADTGGIWPVTTGATEE